MFLFSVSLVIKTIYVYCGVKSQDFSVKPRIFSGTFYQFLFVLSRNVPAAEARYCRIFYRQRPLRTGSGAENPLVSALVNFENQRYTTKL
ncbi:hypothetical protein DWY99_11045 [[Clostridium] leptum]|uniref:Uncharacterized protein n=1 Tax=[Clostridium] leptum TaxID=1535 RepID=A0A412AVI5_9FIRM|nr:hypothetical protein DWY99_11045 [[Clostridium] leptum]